MSSTRKDYLTGVFTSTPQTQGKPWPEEPANLWERIFGPKKYNYLGVCFWAGRKMYYYRTENRLIRVNDVVRVQVPDGTIKPAVVVKVVRCTKRNVPYPFEKTKMIVGRAGLFAQLKFDHARMKQERRAKRYYRDVTRSVNQARPVKDDLDWIDRLEMLDAIFDDD